MKIVLNTAGTFDYPLDWLNAYSDNVMDRQSIVLIINILLEKRLSVNMLLKRLALSKQVWSELHINTYLSFLEKIIIPSSGAKIICPYMGESMIEMTYDVNPLRDYINKIISADYLANGTHTILSVLITEYARFLPSVVFKDNELVKILNPLIEKKMKINTDETTPTLFTVTYLVKGVEISFDELKNAVTAFKALECAIHPTIANVFIKTVMIGTVEVTYEEAKEIINSRGIKF